jgi:signal transduction histidine kinase
MRAGADSSIFRVDLARSSLLASTKLTRARSTVELKWRGEKNLLEMVANGSALPKIFAMLCGIIELQAAPGGRCGVYLVDWEGPGLQTAVAPNLPSSFNDGMCDLPFGSEICPCMRAACLKMQEIAADVETDPLWHDSPFRRLALAHGQRSCWSTPIMGTNDQVFGALTVYQDRPCHPTPKQLEWITGLARIAGIALERAQREIVLGRRETLLAEAQRLSATGSFRWRIPVDFIDCSEQLYRIFELDQKMRLTPALMASRTHPDDRAAVHLLFERARGGEVEIELEHRLLMPDETIKYVHLLARQSWAAEGGLEYLGVVQDVTRRRIAEEERDVARSELVHVARSLSLGALTASIAHEVSQPLSGIITNAGACLRLLSTDHPDVQAACETARRIIRDGSRASEVVTRLRALFSRKDMTAEVLDLNEAARDVIALTSAELQRNCVVVHTKLAEDLPSVTGDRVQLQQVIMNLLLNASDAMRAVHDRPRFLLIRTERGDGKRVRLSVTDAGIGLDANIEKHLFQPFRSTKERGMGIGLFVCRFIIERHRGDLKVVHNEGHGVTFSFSLPESSSDTTSILTTACRHELTQKL